MRPAERYRLIERLGAGSIGVVHRALDLATGREVALKIMPRPRWGTNLRGEFVALARLRHPNVVSVLDYGLTEGGEYFTMELVIGPSLIEAAGPPTERIFYALLAGVLDALAAVHASGMVHADVKPSNILVDGRSLQTTPGRAARLVDFGLAAPLADPSGPTARGTMGYAAPEAWSGRLDPRSDLYSFGVVLWQLVTGSRPFEGPTPRAIVAAQRAGAPSDPRRLRPELPAALADLMTALLDPVPGARPQTADEVLERWRALADTLGHRGVLAERAPSVRTPRVAIEVGTVFGRDHELGELERAWSEAQAGRGAPVLIVGEPGIGKSRLLAELGLRLQLEGGQVLRLSARASDETWGVVRELTRALLAIAGPAWAERGGQARATHQQALATLLATGTASSGPGRWVVAETVAELVAAAGAARPLGLLIDDLDAAAPASIDVLAYLARAVPDARVLLVMAGHAAAPERGQARTPLEDAVLTVARGRRFELAPLGQSSFFALMTAAVGAEVGARIADDVRRVSGGNPRHSLATLDAMVEAGSLARVGGQWIASRDLVVPLLAAARQGAMNRLAALAPSSRALLRAAAILGDTFDRDLLIAILGMTPPPALADGVPEALADGVLSVSNRLALPDGAVDDDRSRQTAIDPTHDDLEAALADAVAARVLTADPAAGRFRFAHRELADALGRELTPGARLEYHRRAALALDDRLAAGTAVPAAALARHHRALGDGPQASRWCLAAADEAARGGDLSGALAHATDALALAEAGEHRHLVRRVAELASQHGDLALALHHFRLASDGASLEEQVQLQLEIAEVERRRSEPGRALEAAGAALTLARRRGDPALEARCHLRIGWLHSHTADFAVAAEHAAVGAALARRAGDRLLTAELGRLSAAVATSMGDPRRAIAILDEALAEVADDAEHRLDPGISHEIGRAAIQAGDYPRAIAALERAVAGAETQGDLVQRARSLNNLAAACYYQGDWARARRLWEQFRQQTERQGDRLETLYALNNLGSLYRELGILGEARAALARAAELAAALGHPLMQAMVLANRGEVDARAGDLGPSRERYDRALAEFVKLGARDDAIETRRRLAELDLTVGRVDEALARALEAARDARDGANRFEEGVLHRVAATALRCQGDFESAAWFVDRARELLSGLGARYELAKVAFEAAELAHAIRDDVGARVHLAAADAELTALGARWDLERLRALQRALGAAVVAAIDPGTVDLARAAAAGDADAAIELALDGILRDARCTRGFVLTLDPQGRPRIRARRLRPGARTFDKGDAEVSGTIVRKVAASGQAIAVADAVLDAELREQSSVVALGVRRVYAAPLRARGRLTGIVYADSQGGDIDEAPLDLSLLDAATMPLALALDHGRLLDDARRTSELMSILAHEIRNPLAGILGYSEMGAESAGGSDTLAPAELFARIRHDAERLRRLVDNVFEMARHEAGHNDWSMTTVDVGKLIHDVTGGFARALTTRRLRLTIDVDEPLGPGMGNADRLAQVLSNLLGNAIKFSPDGATIVIAARREVVRAGDPVAPPIPPSDPRAWIPTDADDEIGEVIRVDVRDHGPGMSAELQAQLFEKFTQGAGAARRGGIGLGLYLSREIIRRHGGSIWVASELGKGATFSFRLPVAL